MLHSIPKAILLSLFVLTASTEPAHAWNDRTHMAVAEAAGVSKLAYMTVGADMAKEKAPLERLNHYSNNTKDATITPKAVLDQVAFYNTAEPESGHLYGAIVGALEDFRKKKADPSKYALYSLGYAMHYIGDLSMPFHNMEYGSFNRANHSKNDAVVESEQQLVQEIRSRMEKLQVKIDPQNFKESLAAQVASIAGKSTALAYQFQTDQSSLMKKNTAYEQLAQSAALLRAVLIALDVPTER